MPIRPPRRSRGRSALRSLGLIAGLLLLGSSGLVSPGAVDGAPLPPSVPLPLGTVTPVASVPTDCPTGSVCAGYRIVCPGVTQPGTAFTATRTPAGTPRGMVLFFAGAEGEGWWAKEIPSVAFLGALRSAGFVTVQVRWTTGWSIAAPGEDAGTGRLACRPASLIRWIHDQRFLPLGLPATAVGRCGFCVTGNSAGASQVSYALSFYGLDPILDGVFPTAGPPHASQDKGCLRREGEKFYAYGSNARLIDEAHGFLAGGGPCARADAAFLPRWLAESVDTGGRDFVHPSTRLVFIHSDRDNPAVPHALDYIARLRAAGTPLLVERVIPGMPHRLQISAAGLAALFDAVIA